MTERLQAAKGQTQSLISNTSELRKEGRRIEMRQEAARSFIDKFQLTPKPRSKITLFRLERHCRVTT